MFNKIKLFSCGLIFLFITTCAQEIRELTLDKLNFSENESIVKNNKLVYEFYSKSNKSRDTVLYKNYNSVKTYLITNGNLLNYDGIKGDRLLLYTFDGTIGEYGFQVSGKENVEKMIAKLFKKYPNLRSYTNTAAVRFKAKINDFTYVQIWINDDLSDVISMELEFSTKYKKGSSFLSFNYDDDINYRKKYEENIVIEYSPNKEKKYKVVLEPK